MKSFALALFVALLTGSTLAQGTAPKIRRQPVQLKVRHADPWAVKALLEGQSIMSPELSTILNLMGVPPQTSQGVNGLFTDGKLIINPADNSIWFIPNN